MSKVCIVYGSSMGNTEEAANLIANKLGIDDVYNIGQTDADTINGYEKIIFGTSTWGSGIDIPVGMKNPTGGLFG